ncbi:MAG: glycoside hydrolase family 28 protein [Staphylococcus sp.]|nr:glycoside hydrolase family 28 protein [Staphylococcus sp.]
MKRLIAIFLIALGLGATAQTQETKLPEFVNIVTAMQAPEFPTRELSITKTGAKQGRVATTAIQKAIDRVAAQGGGRVTVPAGKWLSGRLMLKSNVDLHIEEGATLEFTGEINDYLPTVASRYEGADVQSLGAMIYAYGQENIAVTGKGHLQGPDRDCEITKRMDTGLTVTAEKNIESGQARTATLEKIYMPTFIGPVNCRNILIEDVTLDGSIFWNIAPVYCENIIIRGVTVNSHGHPRTDGIDIDSSVNALIENTTLDCGDDCFTLKAGRGEEAVKLGRPTENVVIRNCRVKRGVGGITVGTETAGFIRNVYAENVVMENPRMPLYFKTRRPRGGGAENIWINNIHIDNANGPAIQMDMLGSPSWLGALAERLPAQPVGTVTPVFRNIHVDNIEVGTCRLLIQAKGLPEMPVENLSVTNVKSANKNIKLQDVGTIEITFAEQ